MIVAATAMCVLMPIFGASVLLLIGLEKLFTRVRPITS